MKLTHAHIKNFKGVPELELDFMSNGKVRPVTALLGDNGSGKTTALQAIALVLSLAGRKTHSPEEFRWHGFLPERISSLGKTYVQLWIEFDERELELTQQLFGQWERSLPAAKRETMKLVPPSDEKTVVLIWDGALYSPDGFAAVNQFAGRYYASALLKNDPGVRDYFSSLGSVFWFDQMRNLGQALLGGKGDSPEQQYAESWSSGVEQLRRFLVGWWAVHKSPSAGNRDYIPDLLKAFNHVFPDVAFDGVAERSAGSDDGSDLYFNLRRGEKVFDISEMSSGEQAVFPLMYEFVRLDIAKSIVLIDELELHLHPPQQQALLSALPRIGPDCQFIVTTHSPYLEGAIPDEHEYRLPGGRPCL